MYSKSSTIIILDMESEIPLKDEIKLKENNAEIILAPEEEFKTDINRDIKTIQILDKPEISLKHESITNIRKQRRKREFKKKKKRVSRKNKVTKLTQKPNEINHMIINKSGTKLFHGIIIGSFIGATVTNFILDNFRV